MQHIPLLHQCLTIAIEAHGIQTRKFSSLPAIVHELEVVKTLESIGFTDGTTLGAAMLHDSLEDCEVNQVPLIKSKISMVDASRTILDTVEELTFWQDSLESKPEYMERVAHKASLRAYVIKVVDRYCNLKDFIHNDTTTNTKPYAPIYAHKARSLVDAWKMERSTSICQWMGEQVAINLYDLVNFIENIYLNDGRL
jgi:(p)ppGpp synthase/HD superfamily hydrolase